MAPLLPQFGFTEPSEGKKSDEKNVVDTLISPAFQHALSSFCSAFPSGQLGPLVEQFEFGTIAVQVNNCQLPMAVKLDQNNYILID